MTTMADISTMLKRARERQGISMREASRRSGVSLAQLSKLESGGSDNPTYLTIISVSRVYGIQPRQWF